MKTLRLIFLQIALASILLEGISYMFLKYSSNPLYRARRILRFEEDIGWFQKPELKTSFEGATVETNFEGFRNGSEMATPFLLALGPSSAFGWGVEKQETYADLSAGGKPYVNAAGIGHSIYQGKRLLETRLRNVSPKFALISYGINDLDKFRFFDATTTPDELYFSHKLTTPFLDSVPSHFFTILSLAKNLADHLSDCRNLVGPAVRVPWAKFEGYLSDIVQALTKKGTKVILINTPFYLKNPGPEFSEAVILEAYAKASDLVLRGDCSGAHEALKQAKSLEPDNIRFQVTAFNQRMKEFAERNKLQLIDADRGLTKNNPQAMFVDPVHPSPNGHREIAGQIQAAMFNLEL